MKRFVLSILIVAFCSIGFSQEKKDTRSPRGQGAVCAARESSVLSMIGWGIGLFAGIAVLCSLIDDNTEKESGTQIHSHSH